MQMNLCQATPRPTVLEPPSPDLSMARLLNTNLFSRVIPYHPSLWRSFFLPWSWVGTHLNTCEQHSDEAFWLCSCTMLFLVQSQPTSSSPVAPKMLAPLTFCLCRSLVLLRNIYVMLWTRHFILIINNLPSISLSFYLRLSHNISTSYHKINCLLGEMLCEKFQEKFLKLTCTMILRIYIVMGS